MLCGPGAGSSLMECESGLLLFYSRHVQLFATPWTVARQAPLSMGFSRQEYWSGLPFPSPGVGIPDPGIEPTSPALQVNSLPSEPPRKPVIPVRLSQRFSLLCSGSPLPGPHPARNLLQASPCLPPSFPCPPPWHTHWCALVLCASCVSLSLVGKALVCVLL